MQDVLDKIVAHKREELKSYPFPSNLESQAKSCTRAKNSMSHAISQNPKGGIIAEFKRRSPSKGWINESANVEDVVAGYYKAGAAACSVLTNEEFFGGSIDHLRTARKVAGTMPLLRKEFIIDPRQIYEARVAGADAVLLIAACLTKEECRNLAEIAHSVELEVLLEIHSESELGHLNEFIDMLGVNNRNLGSFHTDIQNSFQLAAKMREEGRDIVLISESGIEQSATIKELRKVGFSGFLIGETFMKTGEPAERLTKLIEEL